MRKAPAPGAKVAAVLGDARETAELIIPPTQPTRDRGRCRKDARESLRSRRFFSVLIAVRHLHGNRPRLGLPLKGWMGNLGRMGRRLSRLPPSPMEGMAERPRPAAAGGAESGPVVKRRSTRRRPTTAGATRNAKAGLGAGLYWAPGTKPDPTAPAAADALNADRLVRRAWNGRRRKEDLKRASSGRAVVTHGEQSCNARA